MTVEKEKTEKTVEIIEPEKIEKAETKLPTVTELKDKGWTPKELESAEKRGMVQKESESEKKPKEESDKEPKEPKQESETKEIAKEEPKNTLPDFTFKTPEQEKAFLDAFGTGTPQRAMYFRMKAERKDRQKAQEEAGRAKLETQLLKDKIEKMEGKPNIEVDEDGNEVDPEDKPLTAKTLKEIQRKEYEERRRQEDEIQVHGEKVADSLAEQEEYAKTIYKDYEPTVKLAQEVITRLDELVPDVKAQRKILKLWNDLRQTSANADKLTIEDYNAADISYEIGKFHPNYGKSTNGTHADDGKSKDPNKVNGNLNPEQMKRIEANTQRRASSASISGGGVKRTVSVDDLTVKDVLNMTRDQRDRFKKDHPEKMAELLRG